MTSSIVTEDSSRRGIPTDAMMQLLAPDGYYKYLGLSKSEDGNGVGEDVIKKSYRKLSLKHHPDRSGGDAETFRLLNRAQRVLTNPKLRQQYDILGLDLDDDDENNNNNNMSGGGAAGMDESSGSGGEDQPTMSQGIVHEIASMALTVVLQMGVRTVMMAFVSLVVCRYIWTLLPAMAFLAFIAYRIHSVATGTMEVSSPFAIGIGLILMYQSQEANGWFVYWIGEALVIGMFTLNSIGSAQHSSSVYLGTALFSSIAALWFRGKFWNYTTIVGIEAFLAIFVALAFPIMEMLLEAILNDKLKKVGDKVRAHHQHLQRYYESKR